MFLAAILAVLISTYFIFIQLYKDKSQSSAGLISPLIFSLLTKNPLSKNNTLENTIESVLEGAKGTYGIAIKNLKTGKSYYSNERRVFETGSLYKVWVLTTAFYKIEKGVLKENEILSQEVLVLNEKFNIASESAEKTEGKITLSVKDAMERMITISHNYAALLLTEKMKLSSVAAFLTENGFWESSVGTDGSQPTVTPADMALFFEKLYKGELANEENTDKMLGLLKRQRLNNKLPKYLPQDTIIAHKTGELGWFTHDAGIVYAPNGNYIIVVLSESSSPAGAQDRIAQISKAVYEYFER